MSVMLRQSAFSARSVCVAALYAEYATLVRRVLRTHGVAAPCLEDATQDVFLVVFRRYDDFVPVASYKTWLFAIAVRVARDHRRRLGRKGGLVSLQEGDVPCRRSDPHAAAVAAQALVAINHRLEGLAREQREVFILAELEDLSAPEIAKRLSLKLNTVYSRLRSARRDLRLDSPGHSLSNR